MKNIGSRFSVYLAKVRKSHGVYQHALARQLGLKSKRSAQAVSNWETGVALPTPDKLPRIRKILGLSQGEYNVLFSLYEEEKKQRDRNKAFSGELRKGIEEELKRIQIYKAPLYGPKDTASPEDFLSQRRKWKEKTVDVPPNLQGGLVFAFRVADHSMAPWYHKGDLLFCDLDLEPRDEEGKRVVGCVKGQVFCRIIERQGSSYAFKALDPKAKLVTASKEDKKAWFYRVSMMQRDER